MYSDGAAPGALQLDRALRDSVGQLADVDLVLVFTACLSM